MKSFKLFVEEKEAWISKRKGSHPFERIRFDNPERAKKAISEIENQIGHLNREEKIKELTDLWSRASSDKDVSTIVWHKLSELKYGMFTSRRLNH